jgi:CubicO group peptidase (beta-lactamase class C family)
MDGATRIARTADLIRRHSEQQPGGYAALAVASGDEPIATLAFAGGEQVDPIPSSSIASLTKPVTATAIMQLVERGTIGLDDPVAGWVPELRPARPIGIETVRPVTIRDVLSHTSGLSDIAPSQLRGASISPEAHLAAVCRKRLRFPPGSAYAYASDPWYLLSATVERASGVSFPQYLRERILAPLGMHATGFDPRALAPSVAPRGLFPVPLTADEALEAFGRLAMPGGGLWSTPGDMARFGRAMLLGGALDGSRILEPTTVESMVEVQTSRLRQFDTGDPVHYGLGYDRPGLAADGPLPPASFGHSGATGSVLSIDPTNALVVVYLRNWWGASMDPAGEAIRAVYADDRR